MENLNFTPDQQASEEFDNIISINGGEVEVEEYDFDFDYDPNEMYYALREEENN